MSIKQQLFARAEAMYPALEHTHARRGRKPAVDALAQHLETFHQDTLTAAFREIDLAIESAANAPNFDQAAIAAFKSIALSRGWDFGK